MLPLIVGKVPMVDTDSRLRLATLADLDSDERFADHFDLASVFDRPVEWNANLAHRIARDKFRIQARTGYRKIVLLGTEVAEAYGIPFSPYYTWYERGVFISPIMRVIQLAVMPDPSDDQRGASKFLRGLFDVSS